jgi:hypothetical protein
MRFTCQKNSEKNDKTIDDTDQDLSINLRNHLQQVTSNVHLRNSLDHDLRLIDLTHAQEKKNEHK